MESKNGGRFVTATATSLFLCRRSVCSVTEASSSTLSLQSRSFSFIFLDFFFLTMHIIIYCISLLKIPRIGGVYPRILVIYLLFYFQFLLFVQVIIFFLETSFYEMCSRFGCLIPDLSLPSWLISVPNCRKQACFYAIIKNFFWLN